MRGIVSKFIKVLKTGEIQIKRLIGVKKYEFDRNHILTGFEGDSTFIKLKDYVVVDFIRSINDFSIVNVCPSSQSLNRLQKEKLGEHRTVNLLARVHNIYKNNFSSLHKHFVVIMWFLFWLAILYEVAGFTSAIFGAIIVQILTYIPLEYLKFYVLRELD